MKREQHRNDLLQSVCGKVVLYKSKGHTASLPDWVVIGWRMGCNGIKRNKGITTYINYKNK